VTRAHLTAAVAAAAATFAIFVGQAAGGTTVLASVSSSGATANAASARDVGFDPVSGVSYSADTIAISGDGRYVAFSSRATNLVGGDTNGVIDVFVRDLAAGTTERVSVPSSGEQGDADSGVEHASTLGRPVAISADGRFVGFTSLASNLVAGDANGLQDVFVHDRVTGATERASSGAFAAHDPSLSDDGRFVAFDAGGDVYVRDRLAGTVEDVSVGRQPQLTPDGRYVAFIGPGDNAFVADRTTGTTERVNLPNATDPAPGFSLAATVRISDDGRYVSFLAFEGVVPSDTNNLLDLYVRDRATGTTRRASVTTAGGEGGAQAFDNDLTGDGRVAFFDAVAEFAQPYGGGSEIFARDLAAGTTETVSLDDAGAALGSSVMGSASADGRYVAFGHFTRRSDGSADWQVYVRDRLAPNVAAPTFDANPHVVGSDVLVSATAAGGVGGIVAAEYFVDSDPGAGSATPMTVTGSTLSTRLSALSPGVYTIGVRARDGSGAWSAAATALLVVYDPSGGFVTGGGWVVPGGASSDPGDLLPGLDGASKANFGFNVKYAKGTSTVPGGALQFHYNAGKLHLKSAGFDWLVVTNTNWAKFQGLATIDGAGGALYPFRVDARDGSPDRLVLKVWAPGSDPSSAEPLYKASGDVSGGEITIHR
jgi:Tol biopolymer transport system component